MSFRRYENAADFSQHALPELKKDKGLNNLMLGVLGQMLSADSVANGLYSYHLGVGEGLWAIHIPHHNLILTSGPQNAIIALAKALSQTDIVLPGVVGPYDTAEWFANEWARIKSVPSRLSMNQKILELSNPPQTFSIEGQMRLARENDVGLLTNWSLEFFTESLPAEKPSVQIAQKMTEYRIKRSELFIWEKQGVSRAMTFGSQPHFEMSRISFVYTPNSQRRKGFATALVSSVSEALLKQGAKTCCLYTDAANPTSNRIYMKIGYKVIGDSKHYIFADPD